jgi:hypothetical protein
LVTFFVTFLGATFFFFVDFCGFFVLGILPPILVLLFYLPG